MVAWLVAALLITTAVTQAVTPFIRHDDWTYLLPAHTEGVPDVLGRNLREGRWLNYAWWFAIGQHSTTLVASLGYTTAYAGFVAGAWRVLRLALPRLHWAVDAVLVVALFAAPLWVRLEYWPATLTPAVVIAAAGVWTLPAAARRRGWLVSWMLVATLLSVLSYPPVGAVLFLCAVVHLTHRRWRDLLLLAGAFLGGFALGVAVIDTLNWLVFGHFGLEISAWRRPNPVHGLHDLRVNAGRAARHLVSLVTVLWVPAVAGGVCVVAGLLDREVRPRLLRLLAALAVVAGLGVLQTLVIGVVADLRGELWAWFAVLLPAVLLLAGSRVSQAIGVGVLVVLAVVGVLTWRSDIAAHQETRRQYAAIVAEATRPRADGSPPEVVVYQAPAARRTLRGSTMSGIMRMMIRDELGVVPRWCRGDECTRLALEPSRAVVDLGDGVVGVVVPPKLPAWF